MSDAKLPISRRHLDIAIERLASRFGEAQRIRRAVANTIVAQPQRGQLENMRR
jgi:hypothetical protein